MRHKLEDRLIMLAELSIKPEAYDAFLEYIATNLDFSRTFPGNITFDILIDENQSHKVVFYEVWDSQSSQQSYMAARAQSGDLTKLLSFLAKPPRFNALRRVIG